MDLLSGALGPMHAGAALLAHPVARDWLALTPPAAPLSDRLRRAAVCVALDGAPALLAPCFVLNGRLALCVRVGHAHLPPQGWWAVATAAAAAHEAPHAARAVVDLHTNTLIEAHIFVGAPPGAGFATAGAAPGPPSVGGGCGTVLLRATVADPLPLRRFPVVTVVAAMGTNMASTTASAINSTSAFASAGLVGHVARATTVELVYRRDCDRCNTSTRPCQCAPTTSLQSASPPPDPSAPPISSHWLQFASCLHNVFHGSFTVITSVRPGVERTTGSTLHPSGAQHGTGHLSTSHRQISVTMNDPLAGIVAAPPPLPTPPPRRLLPRPESSLPATSSL